MSMRQLPAGCLVHKYDRNLYEHTENIIGWGKLMTLTRL